MKGFALIMVVFLFGSCSRAGSRPEWPTVAVHPPDGVFAAGAPNARMAILEFGSVACRYCADFPEDLLEPLLGRHVLAGAVRYRFINVDTIESMVRILAAAKCQDERAYPLGALVRAIKRVAAFDSTLSAEQLYGQAAAGVNDCMGRVSAELRNEAATAMALGVRGVPTFVVGEREKGGRIVGWVINGMHPKQLSEAISEAMSRLGMDVRADPGEEAEE